MIHSFEELQKKADETGLKISDIAIIEQIADSHYTKEDMLKKMMPTLDCMLESVENGCKKDVKSKSGLTGGEAFLMQEYINSGKAISGSLISNAIKMALAVAGTNAAMGKIVAAPTAGSCGILPAALVAMMQERGVDKEQANKVLFNAGLVGLIIASNASISGAEGGCQAECGTASAMAASSIVELAGGTVEMSIHAVAISIKCILGLVCDPVAGLVEVPCVKRNASGVTLAFTAAEMALAGIKSIIPADEVINTMKKIGDNLPASLRETAEAGLADTPTARNLEHNVFESLSSAGLRHACSACNGCRGS